MSVGERLREVIRGTDPAKLEDVFQRLEAEERLSLIELAIAAEEADGLARLRAGRDATRRGESDLPARLIRILAATLESRVREDPDAMARLIRLIGTERVEVAATLMDGLGSVLKIVLMERMDEARIAELLEMRPAIAVVGPRIRLRLLQTALARILRPETEGESFMGMDREKAEQILVHMKDLESATARQIRRASEIDAAVLEMSREAIAEALSGLDREAVKALLGFLGEAAKARILEAMTERMREQMQDEAQKPGDGASLEAKEAISAALGRLVGA